MVWDGKEELSELDLDILGRRTVRIQVPIVDQQSLRVVADYFRGYANMLDVYSRRQDLPKRVLLSAVKSETTALNWRIREYFKAMGINVRDGRPTDKERQARNGHATRTEETVKTRVAQHLGIPKPQQ